MQRPTCERLRVRTPSDANTIFHAVHVGLLPMVSRRLDTEERRAIESGCVYVWEERGANSEATGLGIERWTDSIQWGPSRVRDEFLFYQERRPMQADSVDTASSDSDTTRQTLIKQTYSVFVATPYGRRKWHLIAYFTQETLDHLFTIEDHPLYSQVARLQVPPAMYTCARSSRIRAPSNGPNQFHPYSDPSSPGSHKMLAPLAYLKTLPPPRRHVVDEMALMSFNADILPKTDFLRISG
ncbi:Gti1/Pac2 family-domain-containing protein [Gymnopilus junonius]|uniref:Gti1/Pac2 family-domain-containing protein n=1 Tax=Gymnopilus junonius TaxID=109634 RepID=A0A9P5TNB5_GYMJU|nr:Gti1/Pac2 family-domain-containing protein [Gymnopilus junonius]